jgi:hypothetical protein
VLEIISTLNKGNSTWTKALGSYKKFRNFHGCKLIHIYHERDSNDIHTLRDEMQLALLNILAEKGNFEAVLVHTDPSGDYYVGNIYLNSFVEFVPNVFNTHITSTFSSSTFEFFTTPGELYTSYEKLLMLFDRTTWCLLIMTFFISYFIILIFNFFTAQIKRSLALNITSVFFGVPMLQFPVQSILRYIFTLFLFFCLIFRTTYQGLMFELMTTDKHKPTPQTIDDLAAMNYTVYCTKILDYPDRWFANQNK